MAVLLAFALHLDPLENLLHSFAMFGLKPQKNFKYVIEKIVFLIKIVLTFVYILF